jgi:hypothetical protein
MNEPFDTFDHPILDDQQMADLKIQPGEYPFECIDVVPRVAKSGNKMLQLKLKLFDKHREYIMVDFLVATENMSYKIKHFWESVGKPANYGKQNYWQEYLHQCGYCSVRPQKNKDTGQTENRIVDYIVGDFEVAKPKNNQDNVEKFEDDIPF